MPKGRTDWKALDKLTDEEIERRVRSDPDAPSLTEEDLKHMRRVPRPRIIRMTLGLTQEEFAERFGLSLATVRDWEQGRTEPDQASQTLLKLIARIPREVEAEAVRTGNARRVRRTDAADAVGLIGDFFGLRTLL
jgi:putative transcriptional regulator